MYLATFPLTYHHIGRVDGFEHGVAELRHHEALLQHADHVADAAKIYNARVEVPGLLRGLVDPLVWSRQVLDHWPQIIAQE